MAQRYFAGNTLAAFKRTNVTIVETTTAGTYDSAYVESAIELSGPADTDFIESYAFSAIGTVYVRFDVQFSSVANGGAVVSLTNVGANGYRVYYGGSGLQLQYWNGSAWTNCGSPASAPVASTVLTFMLKVVLNTSMELYRGGTSVASGSGLSGAPTAVTSIRCWGINDGKSRYSQVLIGDFDNRDSHYFCQLANGNGALTDGSGSYTDINETVLDESTSISLPISGDRKSFTHPPVMLPPGYVIGAAHIAGRGRINGSGPSDGEFGFRIASTNYASGGLGLNAGYEPRGAFWDQNPSTASDWTASGFNAADFFVEAA